MHSRRNFRYFFILLCILGSLNAYSQQKDSLTQKSTVDSLHKPDFVEKVKKLGLDEIARTGRIYKEGKNSIAQRKTIDMIQSVSQRVKIYLKDGLDTADILYELERTRRSLAIAKDGIITNQGTTQTQRNLFVTSEILAELSYRMSEQKVALDKYTASLISYKDKLDSLTSDSSLYTVPSDSIGILNYARRLRVVDKDIDPIDTALRLSVKNAEELQLKVDLMVYDLRSLKEDIEIYRSQLSDKILDREISNITGPVGYDRPFGEIIKFSTAKEKLVLGFYVRENAGRILIIVILICMATFFTRSVRRMMQEEDMLNTDYKDQLVLKYPVWSSIFIVLNIFQFIFISPPFIFSFCIWSISILCLSMILENILAPYWMRFWYIAILFFVLTTADNFLLQASRTERWFMFFLSLAGIVLIISIFFRRHLKELKERGVVYFVVFVALAETAALFSNWFGRFNLAKSFMITGYTGIVIAILFFWTIRLINEMLAITFRIYKVPDKRMFYINFDKVGTRIPGIFYVILVLGWFIITGRNFYAFKKITEPVEDFLARTRTVGEFSFSISSIVIFLLIIILSVVLSRLISFFASSPVSSHATNKKDRVGIGSWLLLVRIFIITLGLLFAFAATGIPVDKLTIIFGALSVGIGLGLQSLVTNLVSGLIIAFEKPVNVGDILEVNGKMATMQSIGFRSSVARQADGAHVVIPNGDVLNQHLVNWSMGKNNKKVVISVSVAYGTDLDKARHLLLDLLTSNERILKNPSPAVYASAFAQSSIDFDLSFWAGHVAEADSIRSEVITNIDKNFKTAGIVIPFPQQDINLHTNDLKPPDQK